MSAGGGVSAGAGAGAGGGTAEAASELHRGHDEAALRSAAPGTGRARVRLAEEMWRRVERRAHFLMHSIPYGR